MYIADPWDNNATLRAIPIIHFCDVDPKLTSGKVGIIQPGFVRVFYQVWHHWVSEICMCSRNGSLNVLLSISGVHKLNLPPNRYLRRSFAILIVVFIHNTEIEAYNADVITFDDNGLTFSTTSKNYN